MDVRLKSAGRLAQRAPYPAAVNTGAAATPAVNNAVRNYS